MSSIRLTHREAEGKLPMVCMACGQKASERRTNMFRWSPMGMYWGFGGGYGGLLSLALSKYKSVEVPLCAQDRNHFWKPTIGMLGIVGVFVVLFLSGFLCAAVVMAAKWPGFMPFFVFVGAFVFLFPALIGYTIYVRGKYLRAEEIDDRGITLANVSSGFVRALKKKRHARERGDDDDEDFERRDVSAMGMINKALGPTRRRRARYDDDEEDEYEDDEE
jgi:hypothetical protein